MSNPPTSPARRGWLRRGVASLSLLGVVLGGGVLLAGWKQELNREAEATAASQPEPVERVSIATAERREHRRTTTAIGTVLAARSISLKNEVAGTVQRVALTPGKIVEPGSVLVALDTSVERTELTALEAQARLAELTLTRSEKLFESRVIAESEVDRARAEYDVAKAQSARLRALIAKKVIRAPFRARVGLADVHPGQYLDQGVQLTTLQGVAGDVLIDFTVAQGVAAGIQVGSPVEIRTSDTGPALRAEVIAVDSRVDSATRNATVRARLDAGPNAPSPGASVRVVVPVGQSSHAVAIPVSALRKGPEGDHVWVVVADGGGAARARERKVRTGPVLGESVLVLDGLEAGEQVAASGSFKLREASKVAPATTVAALPAAPRAH
jgi:membrane fusion protein (multidrug efflux system)